MNGKAYFVEQIEAAAKSLWAKAVCCGWPSLFVETSLCVRLRAHIHIVRLIDSDVT